VPPAAPQDATAKPAESQSAEAKPAEAKPASAQATNNLPAGHPPTPSMAGQSTSSSPGQNATAPKPGTPTVAKVSDPFAMMPPSKDEEPIDFSQLPPPTATASPQQQVWMARALDSLDAAVFAKQQQQEGGDEKSQTSSQQQQGQQGKEGQQNAANQAMSQAKQAMSSAAQAQAAAMRSGRTPPPNGEKPATAKGGMQADSKTGAQTNAASEKYGAIPNALPKADGDWGKLPKKMAEQLTQGTHETTSSEYRTQVETYYRVIAEKAKKP
jgi:hypothetical protein